MHKLTELGEVIDVHPLTLLTRAYVGDSTSKSDQFLEQVHQEQEDLLK
ncbi:TPA: XRE family transcriptional regulator [Pseudomonas aeruginosa]